LYDGTKAGLPSTQGWLNYQSGLHTATESLTGGSIGPVNLSTGATVGNLEAAGFSNYVSTTTSRSLYNASFPTLSPSTGFDLLFNLKVDSESHTGNYNRAGFSVTLIGSDLKGIELGFWQGQIWAQDPLFVHDVESESTVDPESGFHQYDLHIQGSTYSLSADGSQILTGPTRDYTGYPLTPPASFAYDTPNFIFMGDNTTDAQTVTEVQSVSVVVPEPASMCMVMPAIALLCRRRRR
jgi:hypothetical protein